MRTFAILLSAIVLGACAQIPVVVAPNVQNDWDRTLGNARRDVASGNYFAADRLFDEYIRVHPHTREAREAAFWKAAYLVDPANNRGSLTAGIAALDGYVASTDSTGFYRDQAMVLRRTAAAAQGLGAMASAPSGVTTTAPEVVKDTLVVVTKSRDEEIASLKDQLAKCKDDLAKATAELDRIKKRLANPSN
ncbi:MAG: hypothetical protein ABI408_12430 [Gemmatimonadaceae bacterium]